MNQNLRSPVGIIQAFIVLGVLFIFTCQCFAGVSSIYKWKDDQGKTHFTDDPLKIPPRYRSGPDLEKRRALPPPKSSIHKSQESASPAENLKKPGEKPDDPEAKKKEKELAALKDALSFLKSDAERYKKYDDYVPQHRHAVLLRDDIVSVLPAKEGLAKKLEAFDSALAKQISGYLKTSLQKDYEAKKREYPRRLIFISERTRINGELPTKNTLIKELTAKLALAPEKNSSQPKPPKPLEPQEQAPDKKEDALKNARKYGAYIK